VESSHGLAGNVSPVHVRVPQGRSLADQPARFVVVAFVSAIAAGTAVLVLPISTADGHAAGLLDALFTATSAVCVTGLVVVDTGSHWSGFGQVVIMVLFQVGGLGFMTLASLIVLAVSRRLGIRATLATQTERRSLSLGDVRSVLKGVAVVTLIIEASVWLMLTVRFMTTYHYSLGKALWHGLFHAVSAFNNAGFGLYSDSLVQFASDPLVTIPIMVAIIIGGLGFPVMVDLYRHLRTPQRIRLHMHLTLHSRLTLVVTGILLAAGLFVVLLFEWRNPATLGPMSLPEKGLAGVFSAVTPRTAGFNVIETGDMTNEGLLSTIVLMFIGAGSAGTSGGIKVGTFALIGLVILSELRGRPDVVAFGRRIPQALQRQATTVAALSMGVVVVTTLAMLASFSYLTPREVPEGEVQMIHALFESTSAFGTVGLTTGITGALPPVSELLLVGTMLIGRVGPATLGAALVLRRRPVQYRYPEEGPIIG
jgi:potassium uptake TrkH family protein